MDNQEDKKPQGVNEFPASTKRSTGRRALRQAQTRAHLLRAAQAVFSRVGLAEATIAQITEKADVGFGTFYLYFSSKEDAYRAIIVEGFAELDERIKQLIQDAQANNLAWKKVLEQVIQAFLRFTSERRELFFMMFSSQEAGIAAGQRVFVPIAMRIAGLLQEAHRDLAEREPLVKQGEAEKGTIESDSLPLYTLSLLAEVIVTILNRTTRWWLRQQAGYDEASQEHPSWRNSSPPSVEEVSALICKFIIVGLTGLFSSVHDES